MDDLGDLVRRAARDLRSLARTAAEPRGLNPHQLRALRTVAGLDDPRPSDVAQRLHIAPRSATDVLDQLVTLGLVERRPHPRDRRATLLGLTASAEQTLGEVEADLQASGAAFFARLDAAERAALGALLTKLVTPPPK